VLVGLLFFLTRSWRLLDFRFLFCFLYLIYYRLGFEVATVSYIYSEIRLGQSFQNAYLLDTLFFHLIITIALFSSIGRLGGQGYFSSDYEVRYKFNFLYYLTIICLLVTMINSVAVLISSGFNLSEAREVHTNNSWVIDFSSAYLYGFAPFLLFYYNFTCRRKRALLIFLLIAMIFVASGQKFLVLLIVHLFLLSQMIKRKKYNYVMAATGVLSSLPFIVFLVFISNSDILSQVSLQNIAIALDGLFQRLVFVGPMTVVNYFNTFPDFHPFLLGDLNPKPSDIIVHNYVYGNDLVGTVNSFSFAMIYAYLGNLSLALILTTLIFTVIIFAPFALKPFIKEKVLIATSLAVLLFHMPRLIVTDVVTVLSTPLLALIVFTTTFELFGRLERSRTKVLVLYPKIRGVIVPVVVLLLGFVYFVQGQIKIIFLNVTGN
jgi:hypothetical protein